MIICVSFAEFCRLRIILQCNMRLMVSYLYIVGIGKVFLLFRDITYVTWMTSALCMRYTVPFSILGWIDVIIYSNSTTLFFKDDVILLTSFPRWHQNCNSQAFIWYCGSIWLFHSTKQHYGTDTLFLLQHWSLFLLWAGSFHSHATHYPF